MSRFFLALPVLASILVLGCGSSKEVTKEEKEERAQKLYERVRQIQTDEYITFMVSPYHPDGFAEAIRATQTKAEQWRKKNSEYIVKGFSTSQNGHSQFTYCLTLSIEKK